MRVLEFKEEKDFTLVTIRVIVPDMNDAIKGKANELRSGLRQLAHRLDTGDDKELLVWVIPGRLACAQRPLRHHPIYGGSGIDLPVTASSEVLMWVDRIKCQGIMGIISLMHPKELQHYRHLDLGAKDLIDLYRKCLFNVRHIPWEDPAHRSPGVHFSFYEELNRTREDALRAYVELPKPVLLHCSAGIDRSSPVAAYIWWNDTYRRI